MSQSETSQSEQSDSDLTLHDYDSSTTLYESDTDCERPHSARYPPIRLSTLDPEAILLSELVPYFVQAMLAQEADEFHDALFIIWMDRFPLTKDTPDAKKVSHTNCKAWHFW